MQPRNLTATSILLILLLILSLGCGEETESPATPPSIDDPQILTPQEIAEIALRSFVVLNIKQTDDSSLSAVCGFMVGNELIATVHHAVKDMVVAGSSVQEAGNVILHPIGAIFAVNKAHDIAILQARVSAPPLRLGNSDTVRIGDTIYVTGNPDGYVGTFSDGLVSAIRPDGGGWGKGTLIQITAPISRGSSGGPVLNDRGEVIGVAMGGDLDGQNLNFAIPVNFLKELLAAQ